LAGIPEGDEDDSDGTGQARQPPALLPAAPSADSTRGAINFGVASTPALDADEADGIPFALAESELGAGTLYGEVTAKPPPVNLPATSPAVSDDDDDLLMRDADPEEGDTSQSDGLENNVDDFVGANAAPRPAGLLVHAATTLPSPGTSARLYDVQKLLSSSASSSVLLAASSPVSSPPQQDKVAKDMARRLEAILPTSRPKAAVKPPSSLLTKKPLAPKTSPTSSPVISNPTPPPAPRHPMTIVGRKAQFTDMTDPPNLNGELCAVLGYDSETELLRVQVVSSRATFECSFANLIEVSSADLPR
jgi:hypothetical protein